MTQQARTRMTQPLENPLIKAVSSLVLRRMPDLLIGTGRGFIDPTKQLWDMPHTLIHGRSALNNRLLLEKILLTHVYGGATIIPKATDAEFESRDIKDISLPYKSFPRHIEFELHAGLTINEREAFIEMLYFLTQSKSITGLPKNVIVLHGLESIHNKHDYALRKLIEGVQNTAWLLMDIESLSHVIDPIKSRCICVSSAMNLTPIYKEIAEAGNVPPKAVKLILAMNTTHDVVDVALRMQIPNGHTYIGHVQSWTRTRLEELGKAYQAALAGTEKNAVTKYLALLRETTQHLMMSGIPITSLVVKVVKVLSQNEHLIEQMHKIVALAAEKEHLHKTKDGLVLDAFIHELMDIMYKQS